MLINHIEPDYKPISLSPEAVGAYLMLNSMVQSFSNLGLYILSLAL